MSAGFYLENNQVKIDYQIGSANIEDYIEDDDVATGDDDATEEEKVEVKAYGNGYSCVTDAFKIVETTPGIKITSQVTAVTDIMGVGAATQYATEVKTKSGNYFLKETWTHCTSSLGQNYYRCFYSNDNLKTILYKKTSSYNSENIPNWNNTITNKTTTKEEVLAKYDLICFEMFDFIPNKQNSQLVKFDRTSNKKYYICSFTFDVAYVNPLFIKNMMNEGGLSSVNIKSISLTYYIEKETLYVRKAEIDEVYSITKGITLDVNMHQNLYINSIGKPLAPQLPSYC